MSRGLSGAALALSGVVPPGVRRRDGGAVRPAPARILRPAFYRSALVGRLHRHHRQRGGRPLGPPRARICAGPLAPSCALRDSLSPRSWSQRSASARRPRPSRSPTSCCSGHSRSVIPADSCESGALHPATRWSCRRLTTVTGRRRAVVRGDGRLPRRDRQPAGRGPASPGERADGDHRPAAHVRRVSRSWAAVHAAGRWRRRSAQSRALARGIRRQQRACSGGPSCSTECRES